MGFLDASVAKAKKAVDQKGDSKPARMFTPEIADEILSIPHNIIHPDPEQPRKERDPEEFLKVSNSIKQSGGNNSPIKVRPHPSIKNEYMIIWGEGRWLSCKEHDLPVKAILVTEPGDSSQVVFDRLYEQITENTSRNDLSTIDEANAIKKLQYMQEPPLSQSELCDMLGYNKTKLSRLMKLTGASEAISSLSTDNITQNLNLLTGLVDLEKLADETKFNDVVRQVREGALFEKDVAALLRDIKGKAKPKKAAIEQPASDESDSLINVVKEDDNSSSQDVVPPVQMAVNKKADVFYLSTECPYIGDALLERNCSEEFIKAVESNFAQAKELGLTIPDHQLAEHILSLSPTSMDTLDDLGTILGLIHNYAPVDKPTQKAAPKRQVNNEPKNDPEGMHEMESFEVKNGQVVLFIKGMDTPVCLSKDDVELLSGTLEEL